MVHNTIDSIEVCILHTLMHNLYIKKIKNIASVFEINLSQDKHGKVFPTIVGMNQTLLVCTPTTTREGRKVNLCT